eukprot:COSAG06_NODE_16739_length_983_cov_27.522181_1_plen_32_part_10
MNIDINIMRIIYFRAAVLITNTARDKSQMTND